MSVDVEKYHYYSIPLASPEVIIPLKISGIDESELVKNKIKMVVRWLKYSDDKKTYRGEVISEDKILNMNLDLDTNKKTSMSPTGFNRMSLHMASQANEFALVPFGYIDAEVTFIKDNEVLKVASLEKLIQIDRVYGNPLKMMFPNFKAEINDGSGFVPAVSEVPVNLTAKINLGDSIFDKAKVNISWDYWMHDIGFFAGESKVIRSGEFINSFMLLSPKLFPKNNYHIWAIVLYNGVPISSIIEMQTNIVITEDPFEDYIQFILKEGFLQHSHFLPYDSDSFDEIIKSKIAPDPIKLSDSVNIGKYLELIVIYGNRMPNEDYSRVNLNTETKLRWSDENGNTLLNCENQSTVGGRLECRHIRVNKPGTYTLTTTISHKISKNVLYVKENSFRVVP